MRAIKRRSYQVIKSSISAIKYSFRGSLFSSKPTKKHRRVSYQKPARLNPQLNIFSGQFLVLLVYSPNPFIKVTYIHQFLFRPILNAYPSTDVYKLNLLKPLAYLENVIHGIDEELFIFLFEIGTDVLVKTYDVDFVFICQLY